MILAGNVPAGTVDFMTKGLPELQKIYALMGAPDAVAGKHFDFPHNDNQLSREYAYAFSDLVNDLLRDARAQLKQA